LPDRPHSAITFSFECGKEQEKSKTLKRSDKKSFKERDQSTILSAFVKGFLDDQKLLPS
jgi:hypothetical protein